MGAALGPGSAQLLRRGKPAACDDLLANVGDGAPAWVHKAGTAKWFKEIKQQGATAILRGLRAVSDFEFEFQLASMNRNLKPDIETLFMTPAEQYAYISSSLVKEVARFNDDVSMFLHPLVLERVKQKLAAQ